MIYDDKNIFYERFSHLINMKHKKYYLADTVYNLVSDEGPLTELYLVINTKCVICVCMSVS